MESPLSPTPHEANQQTLRVSDSPDGAGSDPATPINGDVPGSLDDLLPGGFMEVFDAAMSSMAIAEGLIEELSREHPESADLIWHSFSLLRPTHDLMHKTDMIYRSHCREILQRVIDGADTRPGTAAECCIVCCKTSQIAPLTVAGVGTYMRMWQAAGLPDTGAGVSAEHHEAIRGPAIDEHERMMRRKLAQPWRKLPSVIEHSPRCPATLAS
jgi:hypothetical protein